MFLTKRQIKGDVLGSSDDESVSVVIHDASLAPQHALFKYIPDSDSFILSPAQGQEILYQPNMHTIKIPVKSAQQYPLIFLINGIKFTLKRKIYSLEEFIKKQNKEKLLELLEEVGIKKLTVLKGFLEQQKQFGGSDKLNINEIAELLSSIVEPLRLERELIFELKCEINKSNNENLVALEGEEQDIQGSLSLKQFEFKEEGIKLTRNLSKIERKIKDKDNIGSQIDNTKRVSINPDSSKTVLSTAISQTKARIDMKQSEYQKKDTFTTNKTTINSQTNTPANRVSIQRKRDRAESDIVYTQPKSNRNTSSNVIKSFNKNPSSSSLIQNSQQRINNHGQSEQVKLLNRNNSTKRFSGMRLESLEKQERNNKPNIIRRESMGPVGNGIKENKNVEIQQKYDECDQQKIELQGNRRSSNERISVRTKSKGKDNNKSQNIRSISDYLISIRIVDGEDIVVKSSQSYPISRQLQSFESVSLESMDAMTIGSLSFRYQRLNIGHRTDIGTRKQNQDAILIVEDLGLYSDYVSTVLCVIDGQGGVQCSRLLLDRISMTIKQQFKSHPANPQFPEIFEKIVKDNLKASFYNLDALFLQSYSDNPNVPLLTGATLTLALSIGNKLFTAWIGDCQGYIMTNNNEFIALTEDHIPSNPAETKRIINAGGTVEEGRLNGMVTISRCLGQFEFKNTQEYTKQLFKDSTYSMKSLLSSEVSISVYDIDPTKDLFLCLLTDGLLETTSIEELASAIQTSLCKNNKSPQQICENLFVEAGKKSKKSRDNASIILLALNDIKRFSN